MTNRSKTLYTGVTGDLHKRVFEHETETFKGFTSKYKTDRLVCFERYKYVRSAIPREKQIKGWRRLKKIQLIVSMNPTWDDLAADWFPELNA
jgi:putative endonuclease